MIAIGTAVVAFLTMELVSYSAHRWVMHGVGTPLHTSHHAPPRGRIERNDWFPAGFATVAAVTFLVAHELSVPALTWVALGVTAYGAVYLVVHDVAIHRRLPVRIPSTRYLQWLRDAHRAHHVTGGEPYGMLLPLRPDKSAREEARRDSDEVLSRRLPARSGRRRVRARL